MIKTVTLNPALDKTIILNEYHPGEVNRVQEIHKDAGGKGINVSKMIKNLGGSSIATGILGGQTGSWIRAELERMKIKQDFLFSKEESRTNIKLIDLGQNVFTDINESGVFFPADKLPELEEKVFNNLEQDDLLVLAGSIPPGINDQIYADWISLAKQKGIKTILDADGLSFQQGVKAGPTLIKPNNHELSSYSGKELLTKEEIINSAQQLFAYGVEMIMVSMGSEGAILLTADQQLIIEPLSLEVKSTVGAGDAMVAALALGIDQGQSLEKMAVLSAAASSASLLNAGTKMGSREQIDSLQDQIKYYYL